MGHPVWETGIISDHDFIGEATWAVISLVLGYIFGANWEAVDDLRHVATLGGYRT